MYFGYYFGLSGSGADHQEREFSFDKDFTTNKSSFDLESQKPVQLSYANFFQTSIKPLLDDIVELGKESLSCRCHVVEILKLSFSMVYRIFKKVFAEDYDEVKEDGEIPSVVKALSNIRNTRNSCYFDTVIQGLFCSEQVRRRLEERLEEIRSILSKGPMTPEEEEQLKQIREKLAGNLVAYDERKDLKRAEKSLSKERFTKEEVEKFQKREGILQQLKLLLEAEDVNVEIDGKSPIKQLKEVIFASDFHPELPSTDLPKPEHKKKEGDSADVLKEKKKLRQEQRSRYGAQRDASYVLEVLIDVLGYQFSTRETCSTTEIPGLVFRNRTDFGKVLLCARLPERDQVESGKPCELKELIKNLFEPEPDSDFIRNFAIKEGKILDRDLISPEHLNEDKSLKEKTLAAGNVSLRNEMKSFPPVLAIQIARFNNQLEKEETPVLLPAEGLLDLSSFRSLKIPPHISAKYRLTGYVMHEGKRLDFGHYTSHIKLEHSYLKCDDLGSARKISKDQFYGTTNPYILIFEQVVEA